MRPGGAEPSHEERRFAFASLVVWLAVTVAWWALAFASIEAAPVWLARARAVCFGTLPNGLPDTWGWGTLIVSPLAILGLLVAVWGPALAAAVRGLGTRHAGRAALLGMVMVPLAGGVWVAAEVRSAGQLADAVAPVPESALADTYPVDRSPAPALGLIDQHGARFELDRLAGRPALVTFAFAHCRTVCPVIVGTVKRAAEELGASAPPVVVVSLDPWRDTPSSLPTLARSWGLDALPEAFVLSGAVDDVLEALERWRMPIERDLESGDIAHPAVVYVLGADGSLGYGFRNPPVGWLLEAVARQERAAGAELAAIVDVEAGDPVVLNGRS